ncbi:MAG: DUF6438 domain-containing protein [Bacteroidota bacterium]
MNKTLQLIVFLFLIGLMAMALGCKNIQKFKESREELKASNEEQTEVIADILIEESPDSSEVIEEVTNTDSLFFAYERTPCFGRCPIFQLKVYQSGFAVYNGTNFVDYIGIYKYRFEQSTLNELKNALNSADFFAMQDVYDNEQVMDLPARIVEANFDGNKKKVMGRYNLPKEFKELTQTIDKIFENIEWKAHSEN